MCRVCECYKGDIVVMDVMLTLCKYDLRKGDLFVLSWARVQQVRQGIISSDMLICVGGVHSVLLLFLVARCLETIDVCMWHIEVTVWECLLCRGHC